MGLKRKTILLNGHLNSWDIAICTQDDEAGVALTLGADAIIAQQTFCPIRIVRVFHFTSEEVGSQ